MTDLDLLAFFGDRAELDVAADGLFLVTGEARNRGHLARQADLVDWILARLSFSSSPPTRSRSLSGP